MNHNTVALTMEVQISGIASDPLPDTVSSPCLRSTIRRVASENNLDCTRELTDFTIENSDGHYTYVEKSPRSSQTLQENEQLPPCGQCSLESSNIVKIPEDDTADYARKVAANDQVWELVLDSQEQSNKYALQDLQDAHEAEKAALQKKVQELESSRAIMEAGLEAKEATINQLVGSTQNLQQSYDKLKKRCDRPTTELDPMASALNHQVPVTEELKNVLKANHVLSTNLVQAQIRAANSERRVFELSEALEGHPNEVANDRGVLELKDKMFIELELLAGESLTALIELEDINDRERETALRETAFLKAKINKNERSMAYLRTSKNKFQRQCEDVLTKFPGKIFKDDMLNAVEEYFKTAMEDNMFLQTEVARQAVEISSNDIKIISLENAVEEARRSLEAKTIAGLEVEHALSAKEVEIAALHMELDSLRTDHQSVIDEKDDALAHVEQKLHEARD